MRRAIPKDCCSKMLGKVWSGALRIAIVAIFAMSCSGLSPNIRNGRTNLLRAVGRDGDVVVYMDVAKASDLISGIAGFDVSGISEHAFDIIVVASDDAVYGVIEGDIPMISRPMIADRMAAHPFRIGDIDCYATEIEGKSVFFDLADSGVILFSTSEIGYSHAFEFFMSNRENIMTESVSLLLQSGCVGVYGRNPRADAGEIFKNGNVRNALLLLDCSSADDMYLLSGVLEMKDRDAFRVTNAYLSDSYIRDLKDNGRKLDMKRLQDVRKPDASGGLIGYVDFSVYASLVFKLFGR
ncbi:MAG TPA: hypothetical protein DCO86_02925 [Spirochaetaceae bacterium]|nr:hypothetical protein [Spirochaetaceae bacterium]